MLRWLLPLLAVFALLGNAVAAYAAAGMIGESSCCCPAPEHCKCHDHDDHPPSDAKLKRCSGEAKLVPLAVSLAEPAVTVEIASEPRATRVVTPLFQPTPDDVTYEPEKPPI